MTSYYVRVRKLAEMTADIWDGECFLFCVRRNICFVFGSIFVDNCGFDDDSSQKYGKICIL